MDTELDEITKQFVPDNTLCADNVQGVPENVLYKDTVQYDDTCMRLLT